MGKNNKKGNRGEITFVLDNYKKMTHPEMCRKLGRSDSFVRRILYWAKLKKRDAANLLLPTYRDEAMDRINKRIKRVGDCWLLHKNEIRIDHVDYAVSRLLYFWHKGHQPGKALLDKTCQNPKCVNPDHMRIHVV